MESIMTWEQIEKNFDQQWIELTDYEWDETEPYPRAGIIRAHAASRKELSQHVRSNPVDDSAILFVGAWKLEPPAFLSFNKHSLVVEQKR